MAFSKLTKLTQLLKNVDLIDGRLVNIDGGSITIDDRVEHKMLTFKSLARIFIGAPLVQKALQNNVAALSGGSQCESKYPHGSHNTGYGLARLRSSWLTHPRPFHEHDSSSWTRLAPAKVIDSSGLQKWEDVLEMFNGLIDWLKNERSYSFL
ncbi:hypothetical protein ACFX2F_017298 [Malus domestica]